MMMEEEEEIIDLCSDSDIEEEQSLSLSIYKDRAKVLLPECLAFLKVVPSDIYLLVNKCLPPLSERLHPESLKQESTAKEKVLNHCHRVVQHLRGLVELGETPMMKTRVAIYEIGIVPPDAQFRRRNLTGIADWETNEDCTVLKVNMNSMRILPFFLQVVFGKTATRQLKEKKKVTGEIIVRGRVSYKPQKLIAKVLEYNTLLRIEDARNVGCWVETKIQIWNNPEISSWSRYLERVESFQVSLPHISSIQLRREKQEDLENAPVIQLM